MTRSYSYYNEGCVVLSSALLRKWLLWLRKWVDAGIEEISVIGKDPGFEDIDLPNARECLDSHSQPLTDMDL
jgi:hypothetical protein